MNLRDKLKEELLGNILPHKSADDIYTEEIIRAITIDSRDRDINVYPSPNNFNISIQDKFEDVKSIQLISADLQHSIPSINSSNNTIKWSYKPAIHAYTSPSSFEPYNDYIFPTTEVNHVVTIEEGYYSTQSIANTLACKMNEVVHTSQEGYAVGKKHDFYIEVNPYTHKVSFINRIESPNVIHINVATNDINDDIGNLAWNTPSSDENAIFFTIDQTTDIFSIDAASQFPLIPTNFPSIGGYSLTEINNRPFTTDVSDDFHYIHVGTISFISGGPQYTRYKLVMPSKASISETKSRDDISSILSSLGIASKTFIPNYPISDKLPEIGRALPFNLEYTNGDTTSSILGKLGWTPRSNLSTIINRYDAILTNRNNSPDYRMLDISIQENYMLRVDSYVYLRLNIAGKDEAIGGNIIKASDGNSVGDLMGQIIMGKYGERSDIVRTAKIYYYNPLNRLTELRVQLVDKDGNLLPIKSDYNFTLEIIEKRDVLKDTLYNSKYGHNQTKTNFTYLV